MIKFWIDRCRLPFHLQRDKFFNSNSSVRLSLVLWFDEFDAEYDSIEVKIGMDFLDKGHEI